MRTETAFGAAFRLCDQQEERKMELPSVLVSLWNGNAY